MVTIGAPFFPADIACTDVTPSKTVVGQGYSLNINVTVENQGDSTETFGVVAPYFEGVISPTSENWKTFWSMGDVNLDGYINLTDLNRIAAKYGWHGTPGGIPEDINSDGEVNFNDVSICTLYQGKNIWTYFGLPLPPKGTQRGARLHPGSQTTLTFTWSTTGFAKGNYTIWAYAWPVQGETDTADNTLTDGSVIVAMVGDVNGDGYINIKDIVLVSAIFGSQKGWPDYNPNYDVNGDGYINIKDIVLVSANFGATDP
jgi:hypothetical protein